MIKEFLFDNREELISTLSKDCEKHLAKALGSNNQASLLVSGGSTPEPVYEALSQANLAWHNIQVALVDERWVDKTHKASNEALIKRTLLINNAEKAPFTGMKTPANNAADGHLECESRYQTIPTPYTLAILGMGNDGHTASLFPHAQGLQQALATDNQALTAAIMAQESDVTGPNTERMSLTLHGLLQTEQLILLLTGEEKLAIFRKAMSSGAVEDMPIRALMQQQQVPLSLYWAP